MTTFFHESEDLPRKLLTNDSLCSILYQMLVPEHSNEIQRDSVIGRHPVTESLCYLGETQCS